MGSKPRAATSSRLEQVLVAYEASRVRANAHWEIYDGQPSKETVSAELLAKLTEKFGGALPNDYAEFLRSHDGWANYEYGQYIMTAAEVLADSASESVAINMENIEEDEADRLADVFVIGCHDSSATFLYYDRTAKTPELVAYYCEELGRWPSLTAYIEHLTKSLEKALATELGQKDAARAHWDPDVRASKSVRYQSEIEARIRAAAPPAREVLSASASEAIAQSLSRVKNAPSEVENLRDHGLRTYLSIIGYMLSVPTADEVARAARSFRKHFPWSGRTLACAPTNEYASETIDSALSDLSKFLTVQMGGHFGIRLVDDDGRKATEHIFNFRGMPSHHDEPVATFLEILLPVSAAPAAVRGLVNELADELPLTHGFSGFTTLPLNSNYGKHMTKAYQWCRCHWGLELALADEMIATALHGLHAASWLTFLDNATADTMEKCGRPIEFSRDDIRVSRGRLATVIEAGSEPALGDVRVAYPAAVASVHNLLAPLFSPQISELRNFDNHGSTAAWWQRFEAPSNFALSAEDLISEAVLAAKAGDLASLSRALGELDARESSCATVATTELSKCAHKLLRKKRIEPSMALYEWLTSRPAPALHDLNNSLVAAWNDTERATVFIERALPFAEKNPSIFHNVIGLYVEQGDLERAIEIAVLGEPHYPISLFKLLESDKDFAPLFERPEFTKIHGRIKARLMPSSDWEPLARNPELEARVGQTKDETTFRQYSDWLTTRDDPRGPLIAAQIDEYNNERSKPHRQLSRKLLKEYIKNRLASRHPILSKHFERDQFHWGVLDQINTFFWSDEEREATLDLLRDPECLFLRNLHHKKASLDLSLLSTTPYLRSLTLNDSTVTSLESLSTLAHIEELALAGTAITDADLHHLSGLKTLRKLYLNRTSISDLSPLAELSSLKFLSLESSRVTDIEPLFRLPVLCELWLYKTKVPKAQARKVAEAINARELEAGPGLNKMVYGP